MAHGTITLELDEESLEKTKKQLLELYQLADDTARRVEYANEIVQRDDVKRLLKIIFAAPIPIDKNDFQLAQEYRNWFNSIGDNLKASEKR
jgi:flagellin-specific chaperone FliS